MAAGGDGLIPRRLASLHSPSPVPHAVLSRALTDARGALRAASRALGAGPYLLSRDEPSVADAALFAHIAAVLLLPVPDSLLPLRRHVCDDERLLDHFEHVRVDVFHSAFPSFAEHRAASGDAASAAAAAAAAAASLRGPRVGTAAALDDRDHDPPASEGPSGASDWFQSTFGCSADFFFFFFFFFSFKNFQFPSTHSPFTPSQAHDRL
jgi:hypothetical protein